MVTYDINWIVPINTNTTTNSTDDPIYVSSNYMYTGVHLINNWLNGDDNKVDIYGELLKRKENELYETKHTTNNTTFNRLASITNKNPLEN